MKRLKIICVLLVVLIFLNGCGIIYQMGKNRPSHTIKEETSKSREINAPQYDASIEDSVVAPDELDGKVVLKDLSFGCDSTWDFTTVKDKYKNADINDVYETISYTYTDMSVYKEPKSAKEYVKSYVESVNEENRGSSKYDRSASEIEEIRVFGQKAYTVILHSNNLEYDSSRQTIYTAFEYNGGMYRVEIYFKEGHIDTIQAINDKVLSSVEMAKNGQPEFVFFQREEVPLEEKDYYGFGDTFVFNDLEITIGSEYWFKIVTDTYSNFYGVTFVKLPIHIKNIGNETNNLNINNITTYSPNNVEQESEYFFVRDRSDTDLNSKLRPGGEIDSYMYFIYDGDGKYILEVHDYENYPVEAMLEINESEGSYVSDDSDEMDFEDYSSSEAGGTII